MSVLFLYVSMIIFFVGFAWAVKMKLEDRIPWQSFMLILLLFTAVAMWLAVIPMVEEGSYVYKPLYAAFYVLESAIANVDYSLFSERLESNSFWRIYTIILHLMMPITTFGAILFSFMKVFGWFRYTLFRGNRPIIIFSELTDKSRAYANRITSQKSEPTKPNSLLIFCNTEDGEKQHFTEDSAKDMIFTDQSEIQILKQLRKKNLTIMEIGEDEDANLNKSVEIIHYLENETKIPNNDKHTINIYTISGQPEAATILDNIMGRGTDTDSLDYRQTIINEHKRIAFKLLYDKPLYEKLDDKTRKLDIMIVGFGGIGQEILKAVTWTGYFPNTDTNVHVISQDAIENGRIMLSEYPELGIDLRHNDGFLKPINGIQLNQFAPIYYYSTKTKGPEFDDIIRNLSHCQYIIIALDDDGSTLETALRIYRLIIRENYMNNREIKDPDIYVRIRDDEKLKLFSSKEDQSVFSHLKQFGSDKDIYSEDQVGRSIMDHLAKRIHNKYRDYRNQYDEKSKYAYLPESKKNVNLAAALHIKYILHFCSGLEICEIPDSLPDDEKISINSKSQRVFDDFVPSSKRDELANWEHVRWQAYMRAEGYVHCPYDQIEKIFTDLQKKDSDTAYVKTKNKLSEAKMHPAISDPKDNNEVYLKKVGKLINNQNGSNHFHENYRNYIASIPDIIRDICEINKPKDKINEK